MTQYSNDDLDELERRMRRKLLPDGSTHRPNTFSKEEQRIADKLLGKAESQRLQNRRDNSRPFKPRKPILVAEYYQVPPMECSWSNSFGGGWRVEVRENGVVQNSWGGLTEAECIEVLNRQSRRGVQIKKIETEWMKQQHQARKSNKSQKQQSKRKAVLARLSTFKLRGR